MSEDVSKELYLKENTNKIICADSLKTLKNFPDESIHCCITSPPYYGLRDYHKEGQIGREATVEEYIDRLVQVFREVRRVLKKDGTCFIVIGDSYAGTGSKGDREDSYWKNRAKSIFKSKNGRLQIQGFNGNPMEIGLCFKRRWLVFTF